MNNIDSITKFYQMLIVKLNFLFKMLINPQKLRGTLEILTVYIKV